MLRRLHSALLVAAITAVAASIAAAAPPPDAVDCAGPAGDPDPGTPGWHQREQENDWCGEQRAYDAASNPLFGTSSAALFLGSGGQTLADPYRDPARWDGARGRYDEIAFTASNGTEIDGAVFRPVARRSRKRTRYPGVLVVHGGSANQEMYLWASEGLAEAGYMVMTFQVPRAENLGSDAHYPYAKDALAWFLATPGAPARPGELNPFWRELDRRRIGIAGHSAGGVAVNRLGHEDPRVDAIVSWDRAQSSPLDPKQPLRTPSLFVVADFNCQRVPVCVPQPYTEPPDPQGPGNKDQDFQLVRAAGVDTMKVALRAATHLDFTQFGIATGSRYGAVTTFYYTLAWLDRYVRGSSRAERRLLAETFDDSADRHSASGGQWDPVTNSNVPATIAGQPVRERLSFHFRSAYFLDGGTRRCEDMRAGCG